MFLFNARFTFKPSSPIECSVPFDSVLTSSFIISLSLLIFLFDKERLRCYNLLDLFRRQEKGVLHACVCDMKPDI